MKRRQMMLRTLAVSMFLFLSAGADAQGVIIHKKYGAPIKVPFAELDSISTYDYEDETPIENGHKYVDLGLPSGTLWATCNVGAEKPEDYGLYFAWGETVGYGPGTSDGKDGDTTDGREFNWTSYKWMDHSKNSQYGCLKYTFADGKTDGCWYSGNTYVGTTVDGKTYKTLTKLEAADDAATANWGENWRMPTKAEQDELRNTSNCTWEKVMDGSTLKGYKVISKKAGYEGNSIFLPAAGYRSNSYLYYVGSRGYYWSSELHTDYSISARSLYFLSSGVDWRFYDRHYGRSVRAVPQKK